ncbi:aminotransferase-like domain-containing protein [Actinomadura rudentiformis]|uniref:PLP-dependent aminotransferase family protein n=1 Tax=Actinomadura rudentiformis TaxID=359158 RepID=A0A6H9YZ44_9ACTN|nr:PLP-dependent aminotransferase family protein [Actinomadura rudentiformis]KAB2345687.1 PLP-dependent aminotransferase family protein [Actinomadura rudentiformis]
MNQDSSVVTLADRLRTDVGRMRAGERLPSSRTLVERHKVSPVTVSRALGLLAAEGLVVTRPGSGTFAADRPAPTPGPADLSWQSVALGDRSVDASGVSWLLMPPPEGTIPLSGGYLHPSLQPLRALAAAGARAVRRPDAWEAPPLNGIAGLRSWFARSVGGDLTAADVLITAGGQQALTSTLRALLPPGAPLLVESPTYLGVLAIARANGLQPVPVPIDSDGVRPNLLAEAFAMTGARVFYCQPTFNNPTGARLTVERRAQVLAVARAAGAFVIEDDFARLLAIEPAPAPMINHDTEGRVVHVAPVTKATSASLRIAAVIARGPVAERIRAIQMVEGFFPARPLQEALLDLVSSPGWSRHLRTVRTALRSRRDAVLTALARELPQLRVDRPAGGPHMWARLPDGIDDVALAESALRAGVLVSAGRPFFPAEPPGPHLRISFGSATSEAELAEGVRRLAQAVSTTS